MTLADGTSDDEPQLSPSPPESLLPPEVPVPVEDEIRAEVPKPNSPPQSPFRPQIPRLNPSIADDDGSRNQGLSIVLFLLGGLTLAVSMIVGIVWITAQINAASRDWFAPTPRLGPHPTAQSASPHGQVPPHLQVRVEPPAPQGFAEADRAGILANLHPRETDEERLEDIRDGFSIDQLPTDPEEIRECTAMAAVIEKTMDHDGMAAMVAPLKFSHPAMLSRIRQLLPPEFSQKQKLTLPVQYPVGPLSGLRVLRLRRLDNDQVRVAYCHLGPNVIDPYRFTLVRESSEWMVADYESIEYGLSFSEVVSMNYQIGQIDPNLASQMTLSFMAVMHSRQSPNPREAATLYRLGILSKVPQPLRDFYRCAGYMALHEKMDHQTQLAWKGDVENRRRFGLILKKMSQGGLSDTDRLSPEDVMTFSEEYIDLFGNASPDVLICRADALARLGRLDESVALWRQVFTINPANNHGIVALAPLWGKPEMKPSFDPLLDEFKFREHVESWGREMNRRNRSTPAD